jgi:hypothetical protein
MIDELQEDKEGVYIIIHALASHGDQDEAKSLVRFLYRRYESAISNKKTIKTLVLPPIPVGSEADVPVKHIWLGGQREASATSSTQSH